MVTALDTTPLTNPATGEVYDRARLDTVETLRDAIAASRKAQRSWADTDIGHRARCLLRVRDYMAAHADELATVISRDNGKTRVDALGTEVLPATMAVTYYAKNARRFLASRRLRAGNVLLMNKRSTLRWVPFGVVGVISPWNYPFSIPFSEVVMALMAGNGVILKVATETQGVGNAITECMAQGGLPEGLFAHVNLPGRVAGDAMLELGVDKLFFTGSVPVGKKLMAKAAETLTPVSLELGGNDPMVVCRDADLERAAAGAVWGGLQNCGQSCGGVERIYVHKDVYAPFLEALATRVRALRVGPDTPEVDHAVDLGAMTTQRQMETVQRHIEEALAKGATKYAESQAPDSGDGNFLPAVVLTDVDHSMQVMREETFGPVLGVMSVPDMDRAVELANDSSLGLTASVWSRDTRGALAIAHRLRAGAVTINDHLMSHGLAETPWGGFKESGIGRTHGELGFREMCEPQVVVEDTMPGVRRNMWWFPHGRDVYQGLLGAVSFLYGRGLGERARGARHLVKLFLRSFSVG